MTNLILGSSDRDTYLVKYIWIPAIAIAAHRASSKQIQRIQSVLNCNLVVSAAESSNMYCTCIFYQIYIIFSNVPAHEPVH